jgi:hypothetical protein
MKNVFSRFESAFFGIFIFEGFKVLWEGVEGLRGVWLAISRRQSKS